VIASKELQPVAVWYTYVSTRPMHHVTLSGVRVYTVHVLRNGKLVAMTRTVLPPNRFLFGDEPFLNPVVVRPSWPSNTDELLPWYFPNSRHSRSDAFKID
jgi:hypothetical protein